MQPKKGNNRASTIAGAALRRPPGHSSLAVAGTWTITETLVAALPAGRDDGLNVTVNPVGTPEEAKLTAEGKVLPPEGVIGRVKVAVAPGCTFCEAPVPVGASVKSSTTSLNAVLVKELKLVSPLYAAVRECDPAARVEMASVAMPALRFDVPIVVVPSEKTTDPLGVPAEDVTVAVRVTAFWIKTGFGDAASATTGAALLTVMDCVTWVAAE